MVWEAAERRIGVVYLFVHLFIFSYLPFDDDDDEKIKRRNRHERASAISYFFRYPSSQHTSLPLPHTKKESMR